MNDGETFENPDQEDIFLVNTDTTCFLCLDQFSTSARVTYFGDAHPLDHKKDIFCLRRIFRYLKLGTGNIFDHVTDESPLLDFAAQALEKITDFSVLLCPDCVQVARKLSTLCEELELVQVKVDNALRKFHGKLIGGSKAPFVERGDAQNTKNPGTLELVHAMVADVLREKTKETCAVNLEAVKAKAKMNKSTQEKITRILLTPPFEPSKEELSKIVSFKLPTMAEIPQERDTSSNLVTCCICPSSANSVFSKDLLFQRHVTCCHLDFLFASLKLPSYTMDQFKAYCEHLLELEIKLSEQGDMRKKKNTDQTPGFICHICGDIFHEVKVFLVHLVMAHYENLTGKLVQLQKSKNITPEQLMCEKKSDIFAIDIPKFKCVDCGRVFAAPSSLYRHRKAPCRQRSEISTKVKNRPFACAHCGLTFTSANGRRLHTKRIHLGIDHNRDRTACELCGKTMSVSSLGRHKNVSCPVRLAEMGKTPARAPKPPSSSSNVNGYQLEISEVEENRHEREDRQNFSYFINENLKVEIVDDDEINEDSTERNISMDESEEEMYIPVVKPPHQAIPFRKVTTIDKLTSRRKQSYQVTSLNDYYGSSSGSSVITARRNGDYGNSRQNQEMMMVPSDQIQIKYETMIVDER